MTQFPKYDLSSASFMADPHTAYAAMMNVGEVIPGRIPFIGKCWLVLSHRAVSTVLKDQDRFARQPERAGLSESAQWRWWMPRFFKPLMQNLVSKDGSDHKRLRGLVDQAFARRDVEEMRDHIRDIANGLLDNLDPDQPVDLLAEYARDLPLVVICELLGISDTDRPMVKKWVAGLTTASGPITLIGSFVGMRKFIKYMKKKFSEVRVSPEPGLITALVEAETDRGNLTEDELLAMVFTLFLAGHETTDHLITGSVVALLDEPEEKAKLLADWSRLPLATEEFLRFVSPVAMTKPRFVVEDTDLCGTRLPRGAQVVAIQGAANQDTAKFDDPTAMDIGRKPNPHLTFGTGVHFCLGLQLARAEAQIAIEQLFTRFPDLELSVARSKLPWRTRIGMRALNKLPVRLKPQS